MAELQRCAGTQFDPQMVAALIAAVDEHGWSPETTPLFSVPDDMSLESEVAGFDHDDPTDAAVPDRRQ